MEDEKIMLERRALVQARELGHTIPRIEWVTASNEGVGTCTRCGDGVMLYVGPDGPSINGTAYESECPGNTCDHGWAVVHLGDGRVALRCLHCGAQRSEG